MSSTIIAYHTHSHLMTSTLQSKLARPHSRSPQAAKRGPGPCVCDDGPASGLYLRCARAICDELTGDAPRAAAQTEVARSKPLNPKCSTRWAARDTVSPRFPARTVSSHSSVLSCNSPRPGDAFLILYYRTFTDMCPQPVGGARSISSILASAAVSPYTPAREWSANPRRRNSPRG